MHHKIVKMASLLKVRNNLDHYRYSIISELCTERILATVQYGALLALPSHLVVRLVEDFLL